MTNMNVKTVRRYETSHSANNWDRLAFETNRLPWFSTRHPIIVVDCYEKHSITIRLSAQVRDSNCDQDCFSNVSSICCG